MNCICCRINKIKWGGITGKLYGSVEIFHTLEFLIAKR